MSNTILQTSTARSNLILHNNKKQEGQKEKSEYSQLSSLTSNIIRQDDETLLLLGSSCCRTGASHEHHRSGYARTYEHTVVCCGYDHQFQVCTNPYCHGNWQRTGRLYRPQRLYVYITIACPSDGHDHDDYSWKL